MHVPADDESNGKKESCYEEMKVCIRSIPKVVHEHFLGDFISIVGRKDIFEPTIWNMSLHEINNVNGVRIVNVATSANLIVKSAMLSTRDL
jgi:hypothetical protein